MGESHKEYLRAPFPIYDHGNISDPHISVDHFSIVDREVHNITRTVKKAMYIRVNNPSLNRNFGKFQLFHIWDEVLLSIPALQLK